MRAFEKNDCTETAKIIPDRQTVKAKTSAIGDIDETNRIREACNLMGIGLLDQIIMANESYYSFADEKASVYGP